MHIGMIVALGISRDHHRANLRVIACYGRRNRSEGANPVRRLRDWSRSRAWTRSSRAETAALRAWPPLSQETFPRRPSQVIRRGMGGVRRPPMHEPAGRTAALWGLEGSGIPVAAPPPGTPSCKIRKRCWPSDRLFRRAFTEWWPAGSPEPQGCRLPRPPPDAAPRQGRARTRPTPRPAPRLPAWIAG